jgi:hypothetical protein
MGNMMEIGQAAGVAAALCSKGGIAPRQLDVGELQDVLCSMGVKLFANPQEDRAEQGGPMAAISRRFEHSKQQRD